MIKHTLTCLTALLLGPLAVLHGAEAFSSLPQSGNPSNPGVLPARAVFEVMTVDSEPLIREGMDGTEGNKYGFEGGCVLRLDNAYHLFVAERSGDPMLVKMRLAHWRSPDGRKWKRVSTLYESSGEFEGKDPRASLWAPMPVYHEGEGRWNLFYVAYRSKPNTAEGWFLNYEGRIWRAVSKTPGREGYGGPYQDTGVVLEPGPDSGPWEGLQGVDSFFPFRAADGRWFSFFGSANTERPRKKTIFPHWTVGLATADKLEGPWRRCNDRNPLVLDPKFVENPVVTRLDDGLYVAVVDGGNRMGYTVSDDGVNWCQAVFPEIPKAGEQWWRTMRTPLCFIPEADGTYTALFTAYSNKSRFAAVGRATFRRIK